MKILLTALLLWYSNVFAVDYDAVISKTLTSDSYYSKNSAKNDVRKQLRNSQEYCVLAHHGKSGYDRASFVRGAYWDSTLDCFKDEYIKSKDKWTYMCSLRYKCYLYKKKNTYNNNNYNNYNKKIPSNNFYITPGYR